MGLFSRNTPEWQQSAARLDAAEDAYRKAVNAYGPDSPQAVDADEAAFKASDSHFGTYGNPNDGPRTY